MKYSKYVMVVLTVIALWATYAFGSDSTVAVRAVALTAEDKIASTMNRKQPILTKAGYYAVAGRTPIGTMASADYKIGDLVEVCNLANKLCVELTVTEQLRNPKAGRTTLLPEPDMALLNGIGYGYIEVSMRLIKGVAE